MLPRKYSKTERVETEIFIEDQEGGEDDEEGGDGGGKKEITRWEHRSEKWSTEEKLWMMEVRQGSSDWHELRNKRDGGILTTSNFGPAVGLGDFDKNGARNLWNRMYRDTKEEFSDFTKMIMGHGTSFEQFVRERYEPITGYAVIEVGYAVSNKYPWMASSSDGYVFENPDDAVCQEGETILDVLERANGLIEIKVPSMKLPPKIKDQYISQVQGQMYLCNKPWCDVMICHISLSEVKRDRKVPESRIIRVYRDDRYWKWMCTRLKYFVKCIEEGEEPVLNHTDNYTEKDWEIVGSVKKDLDPYHMFDDWDEIPTPLQTNTRKKTKKKKKKKLSKRKTKSKSIKK